MARDLTKLETYDDQGSLRVVVESPRILAQARFRPGAVTVKGWGSARMTKAFIDRYSSWTG